MGVAGRELECGDGECGLQAPPPPARRQRAKCRSKMRLGAPAPSATASGRPIARTGKPGEARQLPGGHLVWRPSARGQLPRCLPLFQQLLLPRRPTEPRQPPRATPAAAPPTAPGPAPPTDSRRRPAFPALRPCSSQPWRPLLLSRSWCAAFAWRTCCRSREEWSWESWTAARTGKHMCGRAARESNV